MLTGFIKSSIAPGDTCSIHIDLYSGNNVVDSGNIFLTSSQPAYQKIDIAITQERPRVDSAFIQIVGGKMQGTVLFVDNVALVKNN